MLEVRKLLASGGRFVFSVPHPSLKFWNRPGGGTFPFFFENAREDPYRGYFRCNRLATQHCFPNLGTDSVRSGRDNVAEGRIWTRSGRELNVRSFHKTTSDYIQGAVRAGLSVQHMEELTVTEEIRALDPVRAGSVLRMCGRPSAQVF